MCYSSSTNCDSADDTTFRQTSDQCCIAGGASWTDFRNGSCRQCTQGTYVADVYVAISMHTAGFSCKEFVELYMYHTIVCT